MHVRQTVQLRLHLGTNHKLGCGNGHVRFCVPGDRGGQLFRTVIHNGLGQLVCGQQLFRHIHHQLGIHIAHHGQSHIGGGIECLVAVIQHLRGDFRNAFHCARHRAAHRGILIQCGQQTDIHLEIRAVFNHSDFLTDDAPFLIDALFREVGSGNKMEQHFQIFLKALGAFKIVCGHIRRSERIGLGAVGSQHIHGVALRQVEHFMLQIMGNACGGINPVAAQRESTVRSAVIRCKCGKGAVEVGFRKNADGQAVGENFLEQGFLHAFVKSLSHSSSSSSSS